MRPKGEASSSMMPGSAGEASEGFAALRHQDMRQGVDLSSRSLTSVMGRSFGRVAAMLAWIAFAAYGCGPPDSGGSGEGGADADIGPVDADGAPGGDGGLLCDAPADCAGVLAVPPCHVLACTAGTCGVAVDDSADGSPCSDGDSCTTDDQCAAGACVGAAIACDDGDPCTDDACVAGECITALNTAPCDDGDSCTIGDQCSEGLCRGKGNLCPCAEDAECDPFDDGNACNGVYACEGGFCIVAENSIVKCDPSTNPCQVVACAPASGECAPTDVQDGTACSDGDPCSLGDACVGGACVASSDVACDDGNPCTSDVCSGDAGCEHTALGEGAPCKDNDPCTAGELCTGGACKPTQATICNDGNPCTTDQCQPGGGCVFKPFADGCDDGNACTVGETCATGTCGGGVSVSCDDGELCTQEVCLPAQGCAFENQPNGANCTDGDPCTTGDRCVNGECMPTATVSCDDGDPCTVDLCAGGGACTHIPSEDGGSCDDGDPCTEGEVCLGGECESPPPTCDPCVVGGNWTACDDGNADTTGDACLDGMCLGFIKQTFAPVVGVAQGAFTAVAFDKQAVVATGYSQDGGGLEFTWGAELRGTLAPSLHATSLRDDTRYIGLANGIAVGHNGVVSSVSGTLWDKNTAMNTSLGALSPPTKVYAIWGASLANVPGNKRDVWYVAGEGNSGTPWMAQCMRESAAGGGFLWFCEAEQGFSALFGRLVGVHGWTGQCSTVGCTGLEVAGLRVVADGASTGSSYVGERKNGFWATVGDVSGVLGDRWVALRGYGVTSWGVGTRGLLTTSGTPGWPAVEVPNGPPQAEFDFGELHVESDRAFAVGQRIYSAFGKLAVDASLVVWPTETGSGSSAQVRWVKLGTALCQEGTCQGDDPVLPLRLTGVVLGGLGAYKGLYVVGVEALANGPAPVVYFRSLP